MAQARRTTVYFKPQVYRALKITAAVDDRPISAVVNDAVSEALGERTMVRRAFRKTRKERSIPYVRVRRDSKRDEKGDVEVIKRRSKQPVRPFSEVVRELKRDGLL